MARKRNHPHQDAIHVGGWLSLFTLHAIWPFLWIWATLYKPGVGYGFGAGNVERAAGNERLAELEKTISTLQERLATLESQSGQERPQ